MFKINNDTLPHVYNYIIYFLQIKISLTKHISSQRLINQFPPKNGEPTH